MKKAMMMCIIMLLLVFSILQAKSWTILVYMDGDNNLEPFAIDDINEMERGVDTTLYNVIVRVDRNPNYDTTNGNWTTTRDYYITNDPNPDTTIRSYLINDWGELNMGDPYNLVAFTTFYMYYFPADHYLVILWDHGDGWYKSSTIKDPLFKGIGYDVTNDSDKIDIAKSPEYWWALDSIKAFLGKPIDILAHDACLMGMDEVGYETFFNVDICIFSEYLEPGGGYPYTDILNWLNSNSNATPNQFASEIVNKYIQSYQSGNQSATQSAVLAGVYLDTLSQKIDSFATLLMDAGGIWNYDIQMARKNSQEYPFGDPPTDSSHIDLYDFALKIKNSGSLPSGLRQYADTIMNTINNVVIAEGHYTASSDHNVDNSHGLAIYYPKDTTYINYDYSNLWFSIIYPNWWYFLQGAASIKERPLSIIPSSNTLYISPNPAHSRVTIQYNLPTNSKVSVRILDITGRVIRTISESASRKAGNYTIYWDGNTNRVRKAPAGVYFCKMKCGNVTLTRKFLLLR